MPLGSIAAAGRDRPRRSAGGEAVVVVLLLAVLGAPARAQVLHVVSDERSVYVKAVVACGDSTEWTQVPHQPLGRLQEQASAKLIACNSMAVARADQFSTIGPDAIRIEGYTHTEGRGSFTAVARSDARVRFRIEPGRVWRCVSHLAYDPAVPTSGGSIRLRLLRVTPAGTTALDSLGLDPGHPAAPSNAVDGDRILDSGDYILDVHMFAERGRGSGGHILASVTLSEATGVSVSTWGSMKALYR